MTDDRELSSKGLFRALFQFAWEKKWWWLVPFIVLIVLLILLILLTQESATVPFIYQIF